jgi:hypothetical protein
LKLNWNLAKKTYINPKRIENYLCYQSKDFDPSIENFILGITSEYESEKLLNLWAAFNNIYTNCYKDYKHHKGKVYESDKITYICGCLNIHFINIDQNKFKQHCGRLFGRVINAKYIEVELKACNDFLRDCLNTKENYLETKEDVENFFGVSIAYKLRCIYAHGEKSKIIYTFDNSQDLEILKFVNKCLTNILVKAIKL